jgi:hypothetical protein
MNIRTLTIAAIAAVPTILPSVCAASSDEASLNACAKVFAAGLSTHGTPAETYRISFMNRGYVETEAQYEAGIYTYDIAARDSKSGAVIARAACTVDQVGAVTALSYVPLRESAPVLAAR